jgi:glycosyltransferase involved in cell wall biosynthesis
LRSIQNQNFENIEIIFADDSSKDNSIILIEKYQKDDPRIKLIKHETNVGTLINRNDAAKRAIGEYILFIDCDDLLLNDILNKTYNIAKKENLDIVHFRAYWGNHLLNAYKYDNYGYIHNSTIINQPQLSDLMYYEYPDKILQTEYNLWGKLIKRNVYLKILEIIDKKYLEQHMTLHEDGMILFILFKIAKNYLYLNEFGMFYYRNKDSALAGLRKDENIDKTVRDSFLYLQFMYEYTRENKREKDMAVYQFKFILQQFEKIFCKLKNGFDFIYDVIELYLNCEYISDDDKEIFRKVMYNINMREKEIKS